MAQKTSDNPPSAAVQPLAFAAKAKGTASAATPAKTYSGDDILRLAQALLSAEAARTSTPARQPVVSSLAALGARTAQSQPVTLKRTAPEPSQAAEVTAFPAGGGRQSAPKKTPT